MRTTLSIMPQPMPPTRLVHTLQTRRVSFPKTG